MDKNKQTIAVLNIDRPLFESETLDTVLNLFTGRVEIAVVDHKNDVKAFLLDNSPSLSLAKVLYENGVDFKEKNGDITSIQAVIKDESVDQVIDKLKEIFNLKVLKLSEEKIN